MKKTVRSRLLLPLTVFPLTVLADSQQPLEWLGLEQPQHSMGVRYGAYEEGDSSYGVDIDWQFASYNYVRAAFNRTHVDDGEAPDIDDYSLSIGSDPAAIWSAELSWSVSDQQRLLEIEDYRLKLQFFPAISFAHGQWRSHIGYIQGSATAYASINSNNRRRNQLLATDRSGVSLGTEYLLEQWSLSLRGRHFSYDRNLSAINLNPRQQRLLGQQLLANASALIDWQLAAELGYTWQSNNGQSSRWAFGLLRYQPAIDIGPSNSVYSEFGYALSSDWSLTVYLAYDPDDNRGFGEFAARYYW